MRRTLIVAFGLVALWAAAQAGPFNTSGKITGGITPPPFAPIYQWCRPTAITPCTVVAGAPTEAAVTANRSAAFVTKILPAQLSSFSQVTGAVQIALINPTTASTTVAYDSVWIGQGNTASGTCTSNTISACPQNFASAPAPAPVRVTCNGANSFQLTPNPAPQTVNQCGGSLVTPQITYLDPVVFPVSASAPFMLAYDLTSNAANDNMTFGPNATTANTSPKSVTTNNWVSLTKATQLAPTAQSYNSGTGAWQLTFSANLMGSDGAGKWPGAQVVVGPGVIPAGYNTTMTVTSIANVGGTTPCSGCILNLQAPTGLGGATLSTIRVQFPQAGLILKSVSWTTQTAPIVNGLARIYVQ